MTKLANSVAAAFEFEILDYADDFRNVLFDVNFGTEFLAKKINDTSLKQEVIFYTVIYVVYFTYVITDSTCKTPELILRSKQGVQIEAEFWKTSENISYFDREQKIVHDTASDFSTISSRHEFYLWVQSMIKYSQTIRYRRSRSENSIVLGPIRIRHYALGGRRRNAQV